MGIEAKTDLAMVMRPAKESERAFQPESFCSSFSVRKLKVEEVTRPEIKGTPKCFPKESVSP